MAEPKEEMENLSAEIFSLTGLKVEWDDPLIVAALYQSKLMRVGHHDALNEVRNLAEEIFGNVINASKLDQERLKIFRDAQDSATRDATNLVRSIVKSELPKMRQEFHDVAIDVFREVERSENVRSIKIWMFIGITLVLISMATGILIGWSMSQN